MPRRGSIRLIFAAGAALFLACRERAGESQVRSDSTTTVPMDSSLSTIGRTTKTPLPENPCHDRPSRRTCASTTGAAECDDPASR